MKPFLSTLLPIVLTIVVFATASGDPPAVDLFGLRKALPANTRAWGPEQAIGLPDTPQAGDIPTAWASKTPDGQDEWLELDYAKAVEPAVVMIHESFNPGAVYRITAYSATHMEAELWSGTDPTKVGLARGVSEITIKPKFKTNRIRIHLRSKDVAGWNEIDAVGIKDADGHVQWAVKARASSSYASTDEPDNGPAELDNVPQRENGE